jgi:signal peptidase I
MARKKKTVTPENVEIDNIEVVVAKKSEEEVIENTESAEVAEEVVEAAKESVENADAVEETVESGEVTEETTEEAEVIEETEAVEATESTDDTEVIEEAIADAEKTEEVKEVEIAEVAEKTEEAEADGECEESEQEDTSLPEFMNIEHFADYRAKDEVVDDATPVEADEPVEGEETEDEDVSEGEIDSPDEINEEEFRVYENLTILDELEDEEQAPLPRAEEKISKDEQTYDAKKPRRVDARFDLIEMFVCMMVAIMLLSAFVFRHSVVDGDSMMNTLHDGEHLIISNFFYEPKQYDIIVCEDYSTGLKKPIIKRVIATEGQTVRVVSMDEVYVDGELVDTSFLLIDGKEELIYANKYPIECVVPEGEIFVMGDHRNNSLDSRMLGTIDEDTILGKVVLRFYPFDRFGKVE